jgi:ribonuclease BN (tRNA processing enzyme)
LPDDSEQPAGALADALILTSPGRRLVYATDLADTAENRARLQGLARNAHTLFLEAAFIEADEAQARKHGHLTARACGEIADAAGVARLVPFHLSRRYLDRPQVVYDEIKAVCPRVAVPPADGRDAGAISGLER